MRVFVVTPHTQWPCRSGEVGPRFLLRGARLSWHKSCRLFHWGWWGLIGRWGWTEARWIYPHATGPVVTVHSRHPLIRWPEVAEGWQHLKISLRNVTTVMSLAYHLLAWLSVWCCINICFPTSFSSPAGTPISSAASMNTRRLTVFRSHKQFSWDKDRILHRNLVPKF